MVSEIIRRNRVYIILALLCVVPLLLVRPFSTSIIQNMGIHALNTVRMIAYIIAAFGILLMLAKLISSAARLTNEKKQRDKTAEELEKLKKQKELDEKNEQAKLNVRAPLEDSVIYDRMKHWLNEDWGRLTNTPIPSLMSDILRQMDEMNSYQAKLSRLITNNGADYLEDTNDVLESVEQSILKKVRKILNCFVVYESTRADDVVKMQQLLEETRSANAARLNNVKEFLLAITDFLNKQGDDNSGMEKLNIYKKTILESTEDSE